jgi:heat shock transcription factor
MSLPTPNGDIPVPTPRSIAKALGAPFAGTAQTLQEHNASLAQKSREMEDLEDLQARQNENIDQLMGMMRDFSDPELAAQAVPEMSHEDVDQFFNFGLQSDGFGPGDGFGGDDGQGTVDIEDLLRSVDADVGIQNGQGPGEVLGTNPSTVAASPAASSVGSRAREELEEEVEEVQPKRRRVH